MIIIFHFISLLGNFSLMNKQVLSIILDEKCFKNLKKHAHKEGLSIEEYVIKVLKEFNNVK